MPRLPSTSLLRKPAPASPSSAIAENPGARQQRRAPAFPVPPQQLYQAIYNGVAGVYRWRFDEALRAGLTDATAMRRDYLIAPELEKRKTATTTLPWHIEADDPRDPKQKAAADKYTKIIEATPFFHDLRNSIEERIWYGKAGAELVWDNAWVNGEQVTAITWHGPLHGDSIGYHHDGTPAISVNSSFRPERGSRLVAGDRGMMLLLTDPWYRDRFAIGRFRPTATDFQREADKALALHGLGLRDGLWFTWWLRNEVRGWKLSALERIGNNGQFYGFFEEGNEAEEEAISTAIRSLMMFGSVAFPKKANSPDPATAITHIEPATVQYDELAKFEEYLDGWMIKAISGGDDDGGAGQGQGADDPRVSSRERTNIADATSHGDYLTSDILSPAIRMNDGQLPFKLKIVCQPKISNVGEMTASFRMAYDMRIPFDAESFYATTGIAAPRDGANVVLSPEPVPPGQPGEGMPPGEHAADPGRSPSKGIPAMAGANIPREGHAAVDGVSSHVGEEAPRPDAPAVPVHNDRAAKLRAVLAKRIRVA